MVLSECTMGEMTGIELFKFLNIVVDFLCILHFTSFRSRFCLFCLYFTRISLILKSKPAPNRWTERFKSGFVISHPLERPSSF